jgi:hypothetical protein
LYDFHKGSAKAQGGTTDWNALARRQAADEKQSRKCEGNAPKSGMSEFPQAEVLIL